MEFPAGPRDLVSSLSRQAAALWTVPGTSQRCLPSTSPLLEGRGVPCLCHPLLAGVFLGAGQDVLRGWPLETSVAGMGELLGRWSQGGLPRGNSLWPLCLPPGWMEGPSSGRPRPCCPRHCSCFSPQGGRQKMVPCIPPIFRLWNQHAQLHCLGTQSVQGRVGGQEVA